MKKEKIDYTLMTIIADQLGLVPYIDRYGTTREGFYTMKGLHAPVDLSACLTDESAILRTALNQLSTQVDEYFQRGIERNERD